MTGRLEPKEAPAWQRLAFRYLVSFPIIGLCLALVFAVMFAMLQLQVYKRNANKKKPTKNEKKNQFSTFYPFQPQFSFIRLSHLLRNICVYMFSNSNKVLLCVSHWIRSNLYHSHAKNTHSFIRIALKHFVTCNHLSKSFCPFCL